MSYFNRIGVFLLRFVILGLALAFLLVWLWPELLGERGRPVVELTQAAPAPENATQGKTRSYASAVDQAAPAVVNIHAARIVERRRNPYFNDPVMQRFFGNRAVPRRILERTLGSGVIVDSGGYILTNHHVIQGAEQIQVALSDGRVLPARIVGTDPESDLAVLKVAAENLPAMSLDLSQSLRVGDIVLAIGNPYGIGQTVTMGIVSATGRSELNVATYENFIQTDAAINMGNSGGALINTRGELVGINTAVLNHASGAQGISFAIPVKLAAEVFTEIVEYGYAVRGWLGIRSAQLPETPGLAQLPDAPGVPVVAVEPEGPAALAGIRSGDVLLALNGDPVDDARLLQYRIAALNPGVQISLTVARNSETFETEATLIQRSVQ